MNLVLSQDSNNRSDLCGHIENFLSDNEIQDFYSYQTKQFQPATKMYMIKTTRGLLDDYVGMSDSDIDDPILDSIKQRAVEVR